MTNTKNRIVVTGKIVGGFLATLASILSGQSLCGSPHLFDSCYLGPSHFLPIELFEVSVTLLAISLLSSALCNLFTNLGRVELVDRDIESIADFPRLKDGL